jgi:hypothetical protein
VVEGRALRVENHQGAEWTVDAVPGEVTSATHTGRPKTAQEKPYGAFNKSQCRAKALAFAQSAYPGFDSYRFRLDGQEWTTFGWRFQWQQYIEYDASTLNGVEVDVDPRDGAIEMYVSYRVPVGHPRKPAITGSQAVQSAVRAGKLKSVTRSTCRLQVDPDDATYYQGSVDGVDRAGRNVGYVISVDTVSGACHDMITATGPSPL